MIHVTYSLNGDALRDAFGFEDPRALLQLLVLPPGFTLERCEYVAARDVMEIAGTLAVDTSDRLTVSLPQTLLVPAPSPTGAGSG